MDDINHQGQDNLNYLSKRLGALDRDIRVPNTAKAQALMQRAQNAPTIHAVPNRFWKKTAGFAAALVVFVSGAVYLSPQLSEMLTNTGESSSQLLTDAPQAAAFAMGMGEIAPRSAAPDPRAEQMSAFYAKDYAEVRAALKKVQTKPSAENGILTDGNITTNPDSGPVSPDFGPASGEADTANVDEADIVKTDGDYLYYLCTPSAEDSTGAKPVVKILNSATLAVASTIEFAEDVSPTDMFLSDDKLAVLTNSRLDMTPVYSAYTADAVQGGGMNVMSTSLAIYDISNPEEPMSEHLFEQQGYYSSSRLVDDVVYLITNSAASFHSHLDEVADELLAPAVLNTAISATPSLLAAADICLPTFVTSATYTVVSAVSLNEPASAITKAVLGAGDTVYMSRDNLYVAGQQYDKALGGSSTSLIKFGVDGVGLTLLAQGTVPGQIGGQFALNQSEAGNLCVATTVQQYIDPAAARATKEAQAARADTAEPLDKATREKERESLRTTTQNGVYVLDHYLERLGQAEGLAPEERIKSVRYIGDTAYLVTFLQVDPLFAVDVSDPTAPKLLGQLQVPGFSEYLHPLGTGTLLGLGYETKTFENGATATAGLKLSLFDVSDPTAPTETQTYRMGDYSSSSQAINNHKAFLYHKQQNLVGIPVTLYQSTADPWAHNDKLAFDGLYLFKVTPDKIEYYGAVAHNTELDDKGMNTERGMFVGDALYLFCDTTVTAYSLATLEQTAQVRL